jgi:hypothetical protein
MQPFQNPVFNLCAQCGAALNALTWVEQHARNLWSCEACGYQIRERHLLPGIRSSEKSEPDLRDRHIGAHNADIVTPCEQD